jgi:hypothetical protein
MGDHERPEHTIAASPAHAAMMTGVLTTSAPAVPVGVSGSMAVVWSASFIFIGTAGSRRASSPASAQPWMIRRATGLSIAEAA